MIVFDYIWPDISEKVGFGVFFLSFWKLKMFCWFGFMAYEPLQVI